MKVEEKANANLISKLFCTLTYHFSVPSSIIKLLFQSNFIERKSQFSHHKPITKVGSGITKDSTNLSQIGRPKTKLFCIYLVAFHIIDLLLLFCNILVEALNHTSIL